MTKPTNDNASRQDSSYAIALALLIAGAIAAVLILSGFVGDASTPDWNPLLVAAAIAASLGAGLAGMALLWRLGRETAVLYGIIFLLPIVLMNANAAYRFFFK